MSEMSLIIIKYNNSARKLDISKKYIIILDTPLNRAAFATKIYINHTRFNFKLNFSTFTLINHKNSWAHSGSCSCCIGMWCTVVSVLGRPLLCPDIISPWMKLRSSVVDFW